MLNLTTGEKKRMILYNMAKGNPQVIMLALDEVKRLADDALKATLDSSERNALLRIKESIEAFEKRCEMQLDNKWKTIEATIIKAAKEKTEEMKPTDEFLKTLITPIVHEMVVAMRPSEEELLSLIEPRIPEAEDGEDGETPEKEQLIEIMKPIIAEQLSALMPTPTDKAEAEKTMSDRLYGLIVKAVAEEIGKVKGFYGGGAAGDQVKAGTGVVITQNVLGQKVISVSSSSGVATPKGKVDGSNATFEVTSQPAYVISDGITYFEKAGYSFDSGSNQITLDIPPSQYIRYVL